MQPTHSAILATPNRRVASAYSADLFDQEYFRTGCGPLPYERTNTNLLQMFADFADELIRSVRPRTVLDAGCAMGFLVEAFWDRGVAASGVDISTYAISHVRRDMQPHCRIASLRESIEGQYDLVTCIEVLEHMPWDDSRAAIENLSRITDTILFSSSPSDFTEPTHINVHQPIVWLEQFSSVGFYPDLFFDASFVTPQAMLLRRSDRPLDWGVLRLYAELVRYKIAPAKAPTFERTLSESKRQLGALNSENRQLNTMFTGPLIEKDRVPPSRDQLTGSATLPDIRSEALQDESGSNSVSGKVSASLQVLLVQICRCLNAAEAAVESSRGARESLVQLFRTTTEEWQADWRQLERTIEGIQVQMSELAAVQVEQDHQTAREFFSLLDAANRLDGIRFKLKCFENIGNV
jgi:2-polyprenyl-3-methyl-5-hydroxy-6-metoxy-1,4-benzoquinol methylase